MAADATGSTPWAEVFEYHLGYPIGFHHYGNAATILPALYHGSLTRPG